MDTVMSVTALIVSGISILISGYFASRAKKDRETLVNLELFSEIRGYRHALREWGFETIDAISAAIFLCDPQPITKAELGVRHNEVITRLSSVTDKGRLFIPNVDTDVYGLHKPAAYRGFREPILNRVIDVYNAMYNEFDLEEQDNRSLFWKLWKLRKEFVSELQEIIEPRELEQQLVELSKKVSPN